MLINNEDVSIKDTFDWANIDSIILKRRNNNILLSDYQIDVLKRNGINFNNFNNIHDLLFKIEECLNNDFDDELDLLSKQLSEMIYYNMTNK